MDPYNNGAFHPIGGRRQVARGLSHTGEEGVTRGGTSPIFYGGDHQVARGLSFNLDRRENFHQAAAEVSQNFSSGNNSRRGAVHNPSEMVSTSNFGFRTNEAVAMGHPSPNASFPAMKEQTPKACCRFHYITSGDRQLTFTVTSTPRPSL